MRGTLFSAGQLAIMAVDSLMGYTDLRLLVDIEPPEYDFQIDVNLKVRGRNVFKKRSQTLVCFVCVSFSLVVCI